MKNLSIEDIPVISQEFSKKEALKKALNCFADNKKAKIFISKPKKESFSEEKISIELPYRVFGREMERYLSFIHLIM